MPDKLKSAVITGASSGIGEAIAENVADLYDVCFNLDIRKPQAKSSTFIKTDIANLEEVNKSVEFFTQSRTQLSALFLCAGIGIHEKITEGDPVKWKKVIDTNLVGPLNVIRAFIPYMNEGGDIVIVSSVAAGQPYEYGGVYAATKAALNMIAEALRLEVDEKIRVITVEPGLVKTNFMKDTISGERDENELPFDPISPVAVAGTIRFAIEQPREVSITNLKIRPSAQKF